MKKTVFLVIDGLGDEVIPEMKNKTPLDFASTPHLDKLAKNGELGLLIPTFYGTVPTSEEGHFSLFGYDPQYYQLKRGIISARSVNMNIEEGDVALRGNFATFKDGKIIDRRADRIKNTKPLAEAVNGMEIDGIKFLVEIISEHRIAVLMKGKGLSSMISNNDPAYSESGILEKVKPIGEGEKEKFTATVLNKFIEKTQLILENHPENKKREKPANYLILRGASTQIVLPSFREKYNVEAACIAGDLYQEVGRMIGMTPLKVEKKAESFSVNVREKFEKAITTAFDFVFVHIKETDTLAHDGDYYGKAELLGEIDKQMSIFNDFKGNLIVTSDHSTCSLLQNHCKKKIPFLFWGRGSDEGERFTEKECEKGSLGTVRQVKMMEKFKIFEEA